MRYNRVGTDVFSRQSVQGEDRKLKQILPITDQDNVPVAKTYYRQGNEQLDLIATKAFGPGNEDEWYKIANRNVREIVAWFGDFTYITDLPVPDQNSYV